MGPNGDAIAVIIFLFLYESCIFTPNRMTWYCYICAEGVGKVWQCEIYHGKLGFRLIQFGSWKGPMAAGWTF